MVMLAEDTVTLTRQEHQALLDRIEELEEDLEAAMASFPEPDPERAIPAEVAFRMIEDEESPLRAWRKHRGLTLVQLSERARISVADLTDLETGKRSGTIAMMKQLANLLECGLPTLIE